MNINPRKLDYRGNLFFQITFLWLEKLILKGFRNTLKQEDLFPCPREQCSEYLCGRFEKYWKIELEKRTRPDIKIALAKSLKNYFIIAGIFNIIEGLLLLVVPVLVSHLASSLSEENGLGPSLGYAIVISLIILYLMFNHAINYIYGFAIAMQLRTVCTTALFKKVMKLQQSTLNKLSIGHIINLMSNDVYKLDFGVGYWNYLWECPILLLGSIVLTQIYIGPVGFIGIVYIALHIPLQLLIGYLFGHFRHLQSISGDKRIELMDQIIRGMRVIKFYVWEKSLIKQIKEIRGKEIRCASLAGFYQSIAISLYNSSVFIALFLIYSASIAANNPLTTFQLTFAFLIFSKLRSDTILYFGMGVLTARESVIALKRIQNILELPENIDSCLTQSPLLEHAYIEMVDLSASWSGTEEKESNSLVLKRINLRVDRAQLVVITGPIGSGKSSLLMSLIDELPGMSGHIKLTGVTSYTSQQPWIFPGTFRDNILFSKPLDSCRYQRILQVCYLTEDLRLFGEGDMTLIGERGVTLSGGQKARVALARAIYQEAAIYLLDDPLSAIDTKVGREIFESCIKGFLSDKIVVLVTHHIQYMKQANKIVIMRNGSVVCDGSFEDITENELCQEYLVDLEKLEERESLNRIADRDVSRNIVSQPELGGDENASVHEPLTQFLTSEDDRASTSSILTYIQYFWIGGLFSTVLMLVLTVLSNVSLFLSYWWMQSMSSCYSISVRNATNISLASSCPLYMSVDNPVALVILLVFTVFGSICTFFLAFTFYYTVLQSSRRIHNRMLHRVMYCPMSFFDTNPSGRILNRFSKDTGFLDEQLPFLFYLFWSVCSYVFFATLFTAAIQYFLLIPIAVFVISTLSVRYYFLRASAQVKRIESIARSPLYSHISLSLLGLSTIRALKIEKRVNQDFHFFQDQHSTAWYHYIYCCRWFDFRLDILVVLFIISSIVLAFIARFIFRSDELIYFSLSVLITVPFTFYYVVRISGDVELLMVSADRMLKYTKLNQEISHGSKTYEMSSRYLSSVGDIEFINVSLKYSQNLPSSLADVSLHILAGEKIGIIGRTGAGKSSIFNALCRMNEISQGCILIDRDDISKLNLYQHRKRISVIPQDPVLFSGSLRYNLDPLDELSNDEIWEAVEKCHLQKMVECLPDQLMSHVEENGSNFSTGERQLLCLARAILRKNRIILIDEATANVDIHTDTLVQQAIRTHFSDCTVITIAHRIETIIDSDRIIVLEMGKVIEFEIPLLMLENDNSYLNKLLSYMDPFTQIKLRDIAINGYNASKYI